MPTLSVTVELIVTVLLRLTIAPVFGEVIETTGLMVSVTGDGGGVGVGFGDDVGVGMGVVLHFCDTSVVQKLGIELHGDMLTLVAKT